MRTDVKVGVGLGLLVVLAIVGTQLFRGGDPSTDPNSVSGNGEQAPGGGGGESPSGISVAFGNRSDGTGGEPPIAPLPPVLPPEPEPSGGVVIPPAPEPSGGVVIPPAPEPSGGVVIPPAPEPSGGVVLPPVPEPSGGSVTPPPITPAGPPPVSPWSPVGPPAPTSPASDGTYTVEAGDNGFWAIAAKVYGDGKYHYLISEANPGVSSNSLRIGSKLTIPPIPSTRAEGTVLGSTTPPGGVEVSPTGGQTYVVQKGDNGFWGIAAKQYGNGKYYYVIAKANPGVNSSTLKEGDRIVLPPKPTEGSTGTTGDGGTTTPAAPAGGKYYIVTKDDKAGFWGIAKKEYGNALYHRLIAEANPQVNASALKVGQRLVIPALTDARRRSVESTASAPSPSRPTPRRTDVEDVGPLPTFP